MLRDIDLAEVSDGKLYTNNDMAKTDCGGCTGCSDCCRGMDDTGLPAGGRGGASPDHALLQGDPRQLFFQPPGPCRHGAALPGGPESGYRIGRQGDSGIH